MKQKNRELAVRVRLCVFVFAFLSATTFDRRYMAAWNPMRSMDSRGDEPGPAMSHKKRCERKIPARRRRGSKGEPILLRTR